MSEWFCFLPSHVRLSPSPVSQCHHRSDCHRNAYRQSRCHLRHSFSHLNFFIALLTVKLQVVNLVLEREWDRTRSPPSSLMLSTPRISMTFTSVTRGWNAIWQNSVWTSLFLHRVFPNSYFHIGFRWLYFTGVQAMQFMGLVPLWLLPPW